MRRLILVFAILGASEAGAEDFEIFGGLAFWFPALDTTFDASYTPSRVIGISQLFELPDPRSRAQQSLSLRAENGLGLGVGVNAYPHDVIGFQFLFDRARVDVAGENRPHEVELTYDTIAFPFSDPIVRTARYSFDVPDTSGSLEETTFGFNLVARFGRASPVGGSVSGGLTYHRFRLEAEPVGAHAAWLGGHAVVFSELFEASIATGTADAFGFNVGAALDVSLGSHLSFFADGRLFRAPETEVETALGALLSRNVSSVALSQIESFLDLRPLEIDPSYARILFGLKWKR